MNREAAIAAWLPGARWFAGKGGGPARVSIRDAVVLPGDSLEAVLIDVAHDGGGERYWLALSGGEDVAGTPEFAGWLVRMVVAGGRIAGTSGAFRGHATPGAWAADGVVDVEPLGGDASNTSFRVAVGGRDYAVKLLRRCRPGIQPEVEIGEFLADIGWAGTPRLAGWLAYEPAVGDSTVLATVHEFVAGCTTAWERLGTLVGNGGVQGPNHRPILDLIAALGRTTAEMHRALGSRTDIAAFAPEPPATDWAAAEADRMAAHAERTFATARARVTALPSGVARDVGRLLDSEAAIVAMLRGLPQALASATLIRVHGDYHLGQVLVDTTGSRVLVIDFEGEPGRSLADRRRKTSVLKDLAGMCRSFDYSLRHAARSADAPYRPDDLAMLENTFLDAYGTVARGHAWWPTGADEALGVYRLDKAVYELAYELANRPDWVVVPLAALLDRR